MPPRRKNKENRPEIEPVWNGETFCLGSNYLPTAGSLFKDASNDGCYTQKKGGEFMYVREIIDKNGLYGTDDTRQALTVELYKKWIKTAGMKLERGKNHGGEPPPAAGDVFHIPPPPAVLGKCISPLKYRRYALEIGAEPDVEWKPGVDTPIMEAFLGLGQPGTSAAPTMENSDKDVPASSTPSGTVGGVAPSSSSSPFAASATLDSNAAKLGAQNSLPYDGLASQGSSSSSKKNCVKKNTEKQGGSKDSRKKQGSSKHKNENKKRTSPLDNLHDTSYEDGSSRNQDETLFQQKLLFQQPKKLLFQQKLSSSSSSSLIAGTTASTAKKNNKQAHEESSWMGDQGISAGNYSDDGFSDKDNKDNDIFDEDFLDDDLLDLELAALPNSNALTRLGKSSNQRSTTSSFPTTTSSSNERSATSSSKSTTLLDASKSAAASSSKSTGLFNKRSIGQNPADQEEHSDEYEDSNWSDDDVPRITGQERRRQVLEGKIASTRGWGKKKGLTSQDLIEVGNRVVSRVKSEQGKDSAGNKSLRLRDLALKKTSNLLKHLLNRRIQPGILRQQKSTSKVGLIVGVYHEEFKRLNKTKDEIEQDDPKCTSIPKPWQTEWKRVHAKMQGPRSANTIPDQTTRAYFLGVFGLGG
ncbi:unnamed protein product [Amoebophrya sp. A120]|nr:unnamed protein product [Amoebophrya sp. A120]|eukprot:GSA120T00025633001.1